MSYLISSKCISLSRKAASFEVIAYYGRPGNDPIECNVIINKKGNYNISGITNTPPDLSKEIIKHCKARTDIIF